MFKFMGTLLIVALISSCGSPYPKSIDQIVSSESTVSDIQKGLAIDKGMTVRWGGIIANTKNLAKETWLEVVQLPLRGNGNPRDTDVSTGRFLVKVEGFLDPAIYAKGREFTAVGILSGINDGKVGEFDYKFPVVTSQGYYLWPQNKESDDNYNHSYFYPGSYWRPYSPYYYPYYYGSSYHGSHSGRSSSKVNSSKAQQRK